MKNLLIATGILVISLGLISTTAAQNLVTQEGDITAGAGITLGTNVGFFGGGEPGITLQGYYGITDEIRAGAGFTYYIIGESDVSASEFNIDGHYLFKNEDDLILYGLAGLSFARYSVNLGGGFGRASSGTTGLNIGGGVEYDLGNLFLFAEPKVTVGGWGQFNITAGARLRF